MGIFITMLIPTPSYPQIRTFGYPRPSPDLKSVLNMERTLQELKNTFNPGTQCRHKTLLFLLFFSSKRKKNGEIDADADHLKSTYFCGFAGNNPTFSRSFSSLFPFSRGV